MRARTWIPLLIAAACVLPGCSDPPREEVDAARKALEEARSAGAEQYAPESYRAAEQAVQDLDAELKAQEDKFFKSYGTAEEKAKAARQAADKARADTSSGMEQAKVDVATTIQEARTSLAETRSLLDSAPRGKGTAADIAMLRADLDGVQASIDEAQTLYDGGDYAGARAKAEAARATIDGVRNDVQGAQAAKAQAEGQTAAP